MGLLVSEVKEYRYAALQVAIEKFGKPLNSLSEKDKSSVEKIALKQYELQSRILASHEASGVVIPDDVLQKSIASIIARYPSKTAFKNELLDNELDEESFRYSVARDLRVEAVMDIVGASAPVCSETDARIYYYLHSYKFHQPETRDARHILVTINPDFPENNREQALQRAVTLSQRLQKKPHRFAEQALQYSECPTAMDGGKLGRIKRDVLFADLDKQLFAMAEGQVSDVVESPLGFHVLMCEKIYPETQLPVAQVLQDIMEKVTERNRKNHQREWIKKIVNLNA